MHKLSTGNTVIHNFFRRINGLIQEDGKFWKKVKGLLELTGEAQQVASGQMDTSFLHPANEGAHQITPLDSSTSQYNPSGDQEGAQGGINYSDYLDMHEDYTDTFCDYSTSDYCDSRVSIPHDFLNPAAVEPMDFSSNQETEQDPLSGMSVDEMERLNDFMDFFEENYK